MGGERTGSVETRAVSQRDASSRGEARARSRRAAGVSGRRVKGLGEAGTFIVGKKERWMCDGV